MPKCDFNKASVASVNFCFCRFLPTSSLLQATIYSNLQVSNLQTCLLVHVIAS